ncbi:class I SAM-dependent methyltransferase [Sphingopyxis sp.]|jgi:SAM-dependent methyltransferase|uniref:class I SAM-dependent methyltransferase n=1 Tax=Sphingopyxis sp. TaxID=1908224 RepID=UPI002DFACC72|nr:class I SAM-dependent methyltransferase [Sphingopyxis sp.]
MTYADRRPCAANDGSTCEFVSLGSFDDKSGLVGEVSVAQCRRCGFGISLPPLRDVGFLYADRESQDFQPDTRGLAYAIKNWFFRRQAAALIRQLGKQPASVLDFGCGSGQFTRCLGDLIGAERVTGSDFHDHPPEELRGRNYLPAANREDHSGAFEAVIAMHVLEHDDDSAALLEQIVSMVPRGGTVVIEVPNIQCVWARILGRHWDAWYLPYHRTHFSRRALRKMMTRAGLTILTEQGACVPTMGRSFANMFGAQNNLFFLLAGAALHPVQWLGEKLTGEASAIRIIAQRG